MKLFYNAHIFQGNETTWASSLLIDDDGRINDLFFDTPPSIPASAERIDMQGQWIFPGFEDSHTHPGSRCRMLSEVDARDCQNWEEARERIRGEAAAHLEWSQVIVHGWTPRKWGNVTAEDLEGIIDRPLVLLHISYHGALLNHSARERFGCETFSVEEQAYERLAIATLPRKETLLKSIREYHRRLHALGVTAAHDMHLATADQIEAYRELDRTSQLQMETVAYVNPRLLDDPIFLDALNNPGDRFRIGGLKLFMDGAIGLRTAYLSQPYEDQPTCGTLRFSHDEAIQLIRKAVKAGVSSVAIHAIGDACVSTVLDVYESVAKEGIDVHGWRIEHAELIRPEEIDRIARLGVIPVMQPNFHDDAIHYRDRLGERVEWINPFRSLLDKGVPVVFGSDGMPEGPLYGLAEAEERVSVDSQKITRLEALHAYTLAGSRLVGAGKQRGEIKKGAWANLVVCSENLLTAPQLAEVRVDQIWFRGERIV